MQIQNIKSIKEQHVLFQVMWAVLEKRPLTRLGMLGEAGHGLITRITMLQCFLYNNMTCPLCKAKARNHESIIKLGRMLQRITSITVKTLFFSCFLSKLHLSKLFYILCDSINSGFERKRLFLSNILILKTKVSGIIFFRNISQYKS